MCLCVKLKQCVFRGVPACLVACWKPCSNGRDGGGGDSAFEKSDSDVLPSPPPFLAAPPFLCVWDGAGRGKKSFRNLSSAEVWAGIFFPTGPILGEGGRHKKRGRKGGLFFEATMGFHSQEQTWARKCLPTYL